MTKKFQHLQLLLVLAMGASLAIVLPAGVIALILVGQSFGKVVELIADAFAWIFSLAFFAAFALAMIEQRQRETRSNIRSRDVCAVRQIESGAH